MSKKPHTAGRRLIGAVHEIHRVIVLKNAIYEVNSSVITDEEAAEILARVDAVDPLRKVAP